MGARKCTSLATLGTPVFVSRSAKTFQDPNFDYLLPPNLAPPQYSILYGQEEKVQVGKSYWRVYPFSNLEPLGS